MKGVAFLVSLITVFILGASTVCACSCDDVQASQIESISEAEFSQWVKSFNGAIFTGRVIRKVKAGSGIEAATKVVFRVGKYWKGVESKKVIIHTAANEAACGVNYSIGETYLIVASNYERRLHTGLCQHLKYDKHREIFLRKLGKGKNPKGE